MPFSYRFQSQLEHVGVYQNQWQKPITDFGAVDATWLAQMKRSEFVGEQNLKYFTQLQTVKLWTRHTFYYLVMSLYYYKNCVTYKKYVRF